MNENCSEEVHDLDSVVRKLAKEVAGLYGALGVNSRHDVPEGEATAPLIEKLFALIRSINASANDIAEIRDVIGELDELVRGLELKGE